METKPGDTGGTVMRARLRWSKGERPERKSFSPQGMCLLVRARGQEKKNILVLEEKNRSGAKIKSFSD